VHPFDALFHRYDIEHGMADQTISFLGDNSARPLRALKGCAPICLKHRYEKPQNFKDYLGDYLPKSRS